MAKIGKMEVVRRQLEAAIQMVLNGYDPLPVHNVVSAATQLIKDIAKSRGKELTTDQSLREMIKPEHYKTVVDLFNKPRNFLKHADKDAAAEMEDLPPEYSDVTLALAILCYREIAEETASMTAFMHWWNGMHPELLLPSPHIILAEELHKVLKGAPRNAQLTIARLYSAIGLADLEGWNSQRESLRRNYPEVDARLTVYELQSRLMFQKFNALRDQT